MPHSAYPTLWSVKNSFAATVLGFRVGYCRSLTDETGEGCVRTRSSKISASPTERITSVSKGYSRSYLSAVAHRQFIWIHRLIIFNQSGTPWLTCLTQVDQSCVDLKFRHEFSRLIVFSMWRCDYLNFRFTSPHGPMWHAGCPAARRQWNHSGI